MKKKVILNIFNKLVSFKKSFSIFDFKYLKFDILFIYFIIFIKFYLILYKKII